MKENSTETIIFVVKQANKDDDMKKLQNLLNEIISENSDFE